MDSRLTASRVVKIPVLLLITSHTLWLTALEIDRRMDVRHAQKTFRIVSI
jgi:hypothetical protein